MPTFPSVEASYGVQKTSSPNVRVVQYGDGYQQRLRYGEQQNPKIWNISFDNITETDSDTIESFLDSRANDGSNFDWTPPGESASSKFVCFQWTKKINNPNRASIQATFTEVFEP